MEAYEAKANIWNIHWEGHEIRFEYITKISDPWGPKMFLFVDGSCVATSRDETIVAQLQADDGKPYLLRCGVGIQNQCTIQWPSPPTLLGQIDNYLYRLIFENKLFAWFSVNSEEIYISHIGGANAIEWVSIQQQLSELSKDDIALTKGKIMVITDSGRKTMIASKEELERKKIVLANTRTELEDRLNTLKAKNK